MEGANRYWGARELPTAKTEFFDAVTTPATTGTGSVATIRLYGPIDSWGGYWGVSAKDVGEVLDALPDDITQIVLRINSPGGEVFEALTILNMFGAHAASVIAVVDGLAGSAASFLAAGCAETVMSPGTMMMIHSPSSFSWGNARDLRKDADVLDSIERSIVELYTAKAGDQNWTALLADDTWLTATETVELGLADRVDVIPDAGETATVGEDDGDLVLVIPPDDDDPEDAVARLSRFAATAREPLNPPAEPGSTNRKDSDTMSYESLQAGLRDRLGVTDANATDEQLLAAVEARTTAASASTAPEGTQLVDATALAALQADAAAGRQALANQVAARRDQVVDSALADGRITPAARDMWRAQLDVSEEGATAILNSLAKNAAVPVAEVGVSDTVDMDADAYPANWKR
jgi:ATP-dependent protease ClpP protease subunit